MDNFKVFKNELGELRVTEVNGELYFVANEVANALGYAGVKQAIRAHVDDEDRIIGEKGATPYFIDSLGRKQYPTLLNESGLYSLILSSKKPCAKEFKHWVTKTVLPSIRKNGGYIEGQENLEEKDRKLVNKMVEDISKAVSKKLEYRTRLWHKAVAERDELKERFKKAKKEVKGCRADSDYWFELYMKSLEDDSKQFTRTTKVKVDIPVIKETKVGPDGFVIFS